MPSHPLADALLLSDYEPRRMISASASTGWFVKQTETGNGERGYWRRATRRRIAVDIHGPDAAGPSAANH